MAGSFYQGSVAGVLEKLGSDSARGLIPDEIPARLARYGQNIISAKSGRSIWQLLAEQFSNLLVLLLIVAGILSFLLSSPKDGIVLLTIVILNAMVGFFQDWKSENIAAHLGELVTENAIVLRGGHKLEVPARLLVPGDLIYLQEGDGVPADCRLVSAQDLYTNEFALSGESVPTRKDAGFLTEHDIPLPDRRNYLYYGTSLARGQGWAVVCETGDQTELGKIALTSQGMSHEVSPLQKELNIVGVYITRFALSLAVLLFLVQIWRDEPFRVALVFAVSIAAAMVPAGLPAQISMGLSLGVMRLARKQAIVKRLSSVEALGAATVIATDKTGTMTKNQMTITAAFFEGLNYRITGTGYDPSGEVFDENGRLLDQKNLGDQKILFLSGFLSSTGSVNPPDEFHGDYYALGDPTEAAFATLLMKAGFNQQVILEEYPRIAFFPFDSERKRISIVREHKGRRISFVKGSIESLLPLCDRQAADGCDKPMTEADREELLRIARAYSTQALRVIAIAYRDIPADQEITIDAAESHLTFSGFVTMIDPPREEVHDAMVAAHEAGIRTVMITGDHEATARTIAIGAGMESGIAGPIEVINRDRLQTMSPTELQAVLSQRSVVFSRVSPDEKLKIVSAMQARGDVVAVTGDGVNDTLSLKRADIGVAMGKNGSKVAQEAASLVLLDNSFATIVEAIREGRTIFRNLQTNVVAALSTNITQLFCVLVSFALIPFSIPPVTVPVQILLVDFVGEMLPLLMVTFDPPDQDVMKQVPRRKGTLLNKERALTVVASGLIRGLLASGVFVLVFHNHANQPLAWETGMSAGFATIILTQFISVFYLRSPRGIFNRGLFSNPYLWLGMGISLGALLAILYVPLLNIYLKTQPISWEDFQYIGAALLAFMAASSGVAALRSGTRRIGSDSK